MTIFAPQKHKHYIVITIPRLSFICQDFFYFQRNRLSFHTAKGIIKNTSSKSVAIPSICALRAQKQQTATIQRAGRARISQAQRANKSSALASACNPHFIKRNWGLFFSFVQNNYNGKSRPAG